MPFQLSTRSERRLAGVHPDLVRVVTRAITLTEVDFTVLEGCRSAARQAELYRLGASRLDGESALSRHQSGHAVDLGAWLHGAVRWDWPLYWRIFSAMRDAAAAEDVPIEWGGHWQEFKDGPHYQLPVLTYPASHESVLAATRAAAAAA